MKKKGKTRRKREKHKKRKPKRNAVSDTSLKQFPERPPGKTKNNKTNHRNRRQPFTRFTTLLRSIECTYSMRCGLFSGAHKMQRLRCQQTKQVKERERAGPWTMLALRAHLANWFAGRRSWQLLLPRLHRRGRPIRQNR